MRNCDNCIIYDVKVHMDGFDPAIGDFVVLKRFLSEMVEDWCASCLSYGYGRWQKSIQEKD